MLSYPSIDPIAFSLGPLNVHWYGMMYLVGFIAAWGLLSYRARGLAAWQDHAVSDLILYGAFGVILGGRVGYLLLYNFSGWLADPLSVFKLWQGGMSFHGGLIGVCLAMGLFARKQQMAFGDVADFVAPVVPIGLGAGRLGNFINGELWGKITSVPWGMVFPHAGPLPRHPSQLYEMALEGLLLFIILWCYSAKPRPRYAVSGLFAILYSIFRISLEFFRQPDQQIGYLAWGWLSLGQLYSLPLFIIGLVLFIYAHRATNRINT